jgi:hypothetical protein
MPQMPLTKAFAALRTTATLQSRIMSYIEAETTLTRFNREMVAKQMAGDVDALRKFVEKFSKTE